MHMKAIGFYLTLPLIYLISILPFPILYLLADVVYVILFYVTGYRKKVVYENLRNAFPQKSAEEIDRVAKDFYHNLSDMLLETFKMLTISGEHLKKRIRFVDTGIYYQLKEEGCKGIVVIMSHQFNWEWSNPSTSLHLPGLTIQGLYKKLSNPYFERFIYNMRIRFGTNMIPVENTFREMLRNSKSHFTVTAFVGDQTPSDVKNAYWTTFLNQDTPVFRGTEQVALKLKMAVIFGTIKKVGRGRYEVYQELLTKDVSEMKADELTELHTRKLEEVINADPASWLWSHRRWKHKKPD